MTITTVATPVDVAIFDNLEATDATILTDDHESVDVGPFTSPLGFSFYRRLTGSDLVAWVDAARRVLDEIERVVMDARADHRDAQRVPCPGGCDLLIEPDEPYCGFQSCRARMAAEARVEAYI